MTSSYVLSFLFILTQYLLLNCASAAVHSHSVDNQERESDGSFRARDFEHFSEAGHNSEFDHEAILGSVKEAEEFDQLSPEEAKRRLGDLLLKMDANGDKLIDRLELKEWILNSFRKLSREEAEERMKEADDNRDGVVTWSEYLSDAFGVDSEEEIQPEDTGDTGLTIETFRSENQHGRLVHEEKQMWAAADADGDGRLGLDEFEVFTNPEEHEKMHAFLLAQTMREKDGDKDGSISFEEFIGDRGSHDKAWLVAERDKFEHELDADRDGQLDKQEIHRWIIPDNDEIAVEEVEHLFAAADDDADGRLSFAEILDHYQQFVGSEATDYGDHLMGDHFDDEL